MRENADVFAWSLEEIPGIDLGMTQHQLNIDPMARPVRQRPRRFAPDQQKTINDEVDHLRKVGFITEVKYPQCLSNIVLIKKLNGS